MATITCKDFLDRLESWMEGDVHSDSQAHLRNCPHCRSLVEDLKAICGEASNWRADEIEVFGSWEERKRFIRECAARKKQRDC